MASPAPKTTLPEVKRGRGRPRLTPEQKEESKKATREKQKLYYQKYWEKNKERILKTSKQDHEAARQEKKYSCQQCDKIYASKQGLNYHMLRVHSAAPIDGVTEASE
jgi:hypothetical protein